MVYALSIEADGLECEEDKFDIVPVESCHRNVEPNKSAIVTGNEQTPVMVSSFEKRQGLDSNKRHNDNRR